MEPDALDVAPPRAPERGIERLGPWQQRMLFFGAGFVLGGVGACLGNWGAVLWLAAVVWVVAMRVQHGKAVRWLSFLLGLALIPALAILAALGIVGLFVLSEHARRDEFSPERWKASGGGANRERAEMVDDLLADGILPGRTREQVLDVLGPDDGPSGTNFAGPPPAPYDLIYTLGAESELPVDSRRLVLRFDEQGRVEVARIVTD